MGCYRAPSCTTVSSSACSQASYSTVTSPDNNNKWTNDMTTVMEDQGPAAGPSTHTRARAEPQPAQKRDKGKGKLKSRGEMNAGQKERLRMAYKKKKEVKPMPKPSQAQWSFVYVGNLCSSVTDEQLEALFSPCGPIRRIQIRASGGVCVPTANLPRPYFGFGSVNTGVHYATVQFDKSESARKAMELDKRELAGREIIVTFNIADLPETCDILKTLVVDEDAHLKKRNAWKVKFGQLKRLTIQRTERIPDPNAGGVATMVASVAQRLAGFVDPAATGNTAAAPEAHQNAVRNPLKRAKLHIPGGLLSL